MLKKRRVYKNRSKERQIETVFTITVENKEEDDSENNEVTMVITRLQEKKKMRTEKAQTTLVGLGHQGEQEERNRRRTRKYFIQQQVLEMIWYSDCKWR